MGLAPFIGYLATREPRPLPERAPEEPGWVDDAELVAFDEFEDVGDWKPMRRPLVKVLAVVLSFSLVIAAAGTICEILLTSR